MMFGPIGAQVAGQIALDNLADPWLNPYGFLFFLILKPEEKKGKKVEAKGGDDEEE